MNTDLMDNVMSLLWHMLDALKESRQEVYSLRRELGERDRRIDELSAANSANATPPCPHVGCTLPDPHTHATGGPQQAAAVTVDGVKP